MLPPPEVKPARIRRMQALQDCLSTLSFIAKEPASETTGKRARAVIAYYLEAIAPTTDPAAGLRDLKTSFEALKIDSLAADWICAALQTFLHRAGPPEPFPPFSK